MAKAPRNPRGIRDTIRAWSFLGRLQGDGPVQLIGIPPGLITPDGKVNTIAGPAGATGATGAAGAMGPPGVPGEDGIDGDAGPPGAPGPIGAQGVPGPIGLTGDDGIDGDPGIPGAPGAQGPFGPPGYDGSDGDDGFPGPAGLAGQIGPTGLPGIPGDEGIAGDDGFPGIPGVAGAAGAAGATGATGATGTTSSQLVYEDGTVPGGNTVANSMAATAFTSSYTIPANSLVAGSVIRIKLAGLYSTALVAPNLTGSLKVGSTTVLTTGALTTVAGVSNAGWTAEATLIVTSIGASGSWEAQGYAEFATAATTSLSVNLTNTSPYTIDTTVSEAITVVVQWSSASASNSITLREMTIEIASVGNPTFANPPGGRVTLTSDSPVMTADVTAATTVYYTPYIVAYVPLWDGSKTIMTKFAEISQATTDTTKSPAACTTNSNYDVFVWNDGGTIRATRGPAWTSDTTRGSGAGTTQISRNTDGYFTNTVAITNGPGAGLGTYAGTFRTNGSSKVDFIMGGTGAAGGESTILGVWNMYNRVDIRLNNYDTTDSWNYTTASWRIKNGNNANKISMVIGVQEDAINATYTIVSAGTTDRYTGIGLDSTTAFSVPYSTTTDFNGSDVTHVASFIGPVGLGFHYLAPLEASKASGTTSWFGDNGANGSGAGLTVNSQFFAFVSA